MRHKVWNFHLLRILIHSNDHRHRTMATCNEISDQSFNYRFKKVKTKKIWPRLRKKLMALNEKTKFHDFTFCAISQK